ncbi:abortive infection protein [Paenibacillus rhizovicinus]|uniref:Abortive infection protein n=1 Tax=Paenibacillus rhizovicinus TaxID=2704463 RepID=A0A6C0PAL8_9BACL|nr:abortive infection protein [Paenibacillus rhizovicinus]QHW34693.1 abortive infection protein [Paenibacillus rhizovicinus]
MTVAATGTHSFSRKGINYDVGTHTRSQAYSSREHFDPAIVRRELEIIRHDLHCNAVRISGQDIERLTVAARFAIEQGLEVWFSPSYVNADEAETLAYFEACASAAEELRKLSPNVIFIVGCELTFFMKGLVTGETAFDRMQTLINPWKLIKNTLRKGSFHKRLNAFLTKAVAVVRSRFHGKLTYASGVWEQVNWAPFDFVGIDCYRDRMNQGSYREKLRAYFKHGKPVVVLEFGCCTYAGASEKGGYGWAIVDRDQSPPRMKGEYVRDENEQTRYMEELLTIFKEEQVEGAFWYTFVMPFYPGSENPQFDLDMASYSVVKSLDDGVVATSIASKTIAYSGMPWEPKASFRRLAELYADR